jgi:hypothetical protein
MGKNVHIELDKDQFERLNEEKDRHGLTWKGMLLHGWEGADE